jgi:hypothetical protein
MIRARAAITTLILIASLAVPASAAHGGRAGAGEWEVTLPALPLTQNVVAASPSGDGLAVLTTPQDVFQPPHVLMVSSDHGRSWEPVVTNPHLVFRAIEMDDAGNAYALGDVYPSFDSQRLMSSRDGGRTWTFVSVPGGGMIIDMDVLPGGAVVIARNIEQGGGCSGGLSRGEVLVSADGRAPWRALGPIAEYVYSVDTFEAPEGATYPDGSPQVLASLAVTAGDARERGTGSCGVGPNRRQMISSDGGRSYRASVRTEGSGRVWADASTLLLANGGAVQRSTDDGATYTTTFLSRGTVREMQVADGLVIAQSSTGVLAASDDAGASFIVEHQPLFADLITKGVAHFGSGVAVSFSDRGLMRRSERD